MEAGIQDNLLELALRGQPQARFYMVGRMAERLVAQELARRGWDKGELERRRKADRETVKLARRLLAETTMMWAWSAGRLKMGSSGCVAACRRQR